MRLDPLGAALGVLAFAAICWLVWRMPEPVPCKPGFVRTHGYGGQVCVQGYVP